MKPPAAIRSRVLFCPPVCPGRRKGQPAPRPGPTPEQNFSATLVLGGCRSGKTAWAEEEGFKLLQSGGARRSQYLIYIATAQGEGDPALQERIARHQSLRHPAWHTLEAPLDLPEALTRAMSGKSCPTGLDGQRPRAVLVDCVTVWLANLMAAGLDQAAVLERAEHLARLLRAPNCPVLVVSNETGLGVAPSTALGNYFRDMAGLVNQTLVKSCANVYFIVSGLAQQLKGAF